ncbi:MAG: hypothetical protein ACOX85_11050, partial [Candidatus Pararuminococcus gallinarum]
TVSAAATGAWTYAGGIVGRMGSGAQVLSAYNAGQVAASCAGGIASVAPATTSDSMVIRGSYNRGQVTGYSASTQYAAGIIPSYNKPNLTVITCYYLSGTATDNSATSRTEAELKDGATGLSGFDFTGTWTYAEGENDGYPVLVSFHPSWDGVIPTFDKAVGSENNKDVDVSFQVVTCLLEGLRDGERNDRDLTDGDAGVGTADVPHDMYEANNSVGGDSSLSVLTIRKEYLDGLSLGSHILTARFGANVEVDFQVEIVDTPPDHLIFQSTGAQVSGDTIQAHFQISSPEADQMTLIMAAYRDEGMVGLDVSALTLEPGRSDQTLSLPYSTDGNYLYKAFLLDENNAPLFAPIIFRTPDDLAAQDGKYLPGTLGRLEQLREQLTALQTVLPAD